MSTLHILDNPVWSSLSSSQQHLSTGRDVKRYSAQHAPFIAVRNVEAPGLETMDELTALVAVDEALCFIGPAPALPSTFAVEAQSSVVQMVCERPVPSSSPEQAIVNLTGRAIEKMLALTALVFPGYFRRLTPEMGRYVGVWDGARLAAMAGERMFLAPYREISAVCTHPEYLGRGYAGLLLSHLVNLNLAEGAIPFLHVGQGNTRARSLYKKQGFSTRVELPFIRARRLR